jgi:hypothetical protein
VAVVVVVILVAVIVVAVPVATMALHSALSIAVSKPVTTIRTQAVPLCGQKVPVHVTASDH